MIPLCLSIGKVAACRPTSQDTSSSSHSSIWINSPVAHSRLACARSRLDRAVSYLGDVSKLPVTLGNAVSVIAGPGVMAVVVPWLLTGWRTSHPPRVLVGIGAFLALVGATVLLRAAFRFLVEGRGTLAPIAPPEQLVVGGLYRYVRNPMYIAVVSVIVGESLALGRAVLVVWAGGFLFATVAFVRFYEEPTLARRYGEQYAAYRRAVRGWWPRVHPWSPDVPGP